MIPNVINDYRSANGRGWVNHWDCVVSDYCKEHCWAMVRQDKLFHAPTHYLNGWSEAVARCSRGGESWQELEYKIIYEVLGQSRPHAEIVLNSSRMAYGIAEMQGLVWVTIRGQ